MSGAAARTGKVHIKTGEKKGNKDSQILLKKNGNTMITVRKISMNI